MDFVSTEENPVEWQETFGLYVSEAAYNADMSYLANPEAEEFKAGYTMQVKKEFTNVFEITLSDDFSKGTYKVSNVLLIDMIWVNGSQVSVGGDFYANYDSETSELTLLSENSSNVGYYLEGDVVLKYDAANKKFTTETFKAAPKYPSAYYDVTSYIAGYTAVVKVEEEPEPEPETPGEGEEEGGFDAASLAGIYSEEYSTFMGSSSGTMTITVSDSDISVSMLNGDCICSATLSDDGKTLTVKSDGIYYKGSSSDPFSGDMSLTVGEEGGKVTLKLSSSMNLWGMTFLSSYTATKQ